MAERAAAAVLDFTNTKEGGASFNKKRVPAGDYLAKVTKVEDRPTKDTKEPQWLFTVELVDKFTDRKFPYYCKLVENQLWKVRNLFLAAGMAIPKKKVKLDPNRVVGKLIGITLEDDEFDGKLQSNVAQTFPASELEDGEGEVDETEDELDDEVEDTDEEVDEVDDVEEEEEEEEEPEPEPAPRRRAAAKIPGQRTASPTAKATRRKPAPAAEEVDDEELEELDLEGI